jgi:hypothetical protein
MKIERKKKKKTRRGRKKGRTKEEKTERKKTRKETIHRHRKQCRLEPPPPASTTVSQRQQPPHVSPSPLLFLLLLRLATPTPTVHLACEQWRALFTLAGLSPAHVVGAGRPSPCIWARFGPLKKLKEKKYFSIFVNSPRFDLCFFLLNIGLYFTS